MKEKSDSQEQDLYKQLGVASDKSGVKANFDELIDNEYPQAFVNINDDPSNPDKRTTMHADGDGSKFIQRVLDYYENGDENVFAGIVDDALSMNTSDIAAAGFVFGRIHIVDIFDCGNANIKDVVMRQIAKRFLELKKLYAGFGFDLKFFGGETAELPYQVKSGVFNVVAHAWADKEDIISGDVKAGDIILGVRSDGQASWEDVPNSGAMSNGQTLLRSGAMDESYNEKYPDLGDGSFYRGRHEPGAVPTILGGMTVGEAILSPTRQWAILIRLIMTELKKKGLLHMLHGISINTGGGATKVKNLGKGMTFMKNMPEVSPVFRFIQEETRQPWQHMFTTFNCGIGIDIVGEDKEEFVNTVKGVVFGCCLDCPTLGMVRQSYDDNNHVVINSPYGRFEY